MMYKRIVVIPNEEYLTKDISIRLASSIKQFEWYLMDSDRLNLKTEFYLEKHESDLFQDIHVNNLASNGRMKEKKSWIQQTLKIIDPDLIITFTSANFSYRCVRQLYPDLTVLIIQTGLLISPKKSSSRLDKAKAKVYNLMAQVPMRTATPGFFQVHPKNIYAVYSSSSVPKKKAEKYNVVVIGNLNLDEAFLPQYRKSTTKVSETTNALYATQPILHYFGVESHQRNLELLKDILQNNPSIKLTVKFHPRDKINTYQDLIQQFPDNIKFADSDKNILPLMDEHDVLFSHFSAAIDIAVTINMPVVSLDPESIYESNLKGNGNFIIKIRDSQDFVLSNKYYSDSETRLEERKSYLNDVTGFNDGASFKRLMKVVCDQMEGRSTVEA
jgi:hypothetical protein